MTKQTKLKKCPFCGKKPTLFKCLENNEEDYVRCMNLYCHLWDRFPIESWNRRVKK